MGRIPWRYYHASGVGCFRCELEKNHHGVLARFADPAFACDGTRFLKKLNVAFVRDVDARYLGRMCSVRIASLHNEA